MARACNRANWNRLLDAALIHGAKQIGNFDKLRKVVSINIAKGEKGNTSFRPQDYRYRAKMRMVRGAGLWSSGQNLKCSVEVSFLSRNKEGAEHAGKPGTMRLN